MSLGQRARMRDRQKDIETVEQSEADEPQKMGLIKFWEFHEDNKTSTYSEKELPI